MKKLTLILLAVLCAASLASCGGKSGDDKKDTGKIETDSVIKKAEYPIIEESGGYTFSVFEDSVTITAYNGGEVDVSVPSSHTGKPVTTIADSTSFDGVQTIEIPSSVTLIGSGVFSGNTTIKTINLQAQLISVADDMFSGCTVLSDITIPSTVTKIGIRSFNGCTALTSVSLPASVTEIGQSAFAGCTSLANVTIPAVEFIEQSTFSGCTALTSVTLPSGITTIDAYAFSGCSALAAVSLPDTIVSIDSTAFAGTAWIASFTDEFVIVGDGNLIMYKPVTAEGSEAASTPVAVTIPSTVKSISGAFSGHTEISSVSIPASVTTIGANAFFGCTSLTSVAIPDSVQFIGDGAFAGCTGITSMYLPSSLLSVGNRAFASGGFTAIAFSGDVTLGADVFSGLASLTVTCPTGSDIANYCNFHKINYSES